MSESACYHPGEGLSPAYICAQTFFLASWGILAVLVTGGLRNAPRIAPHAVAGFNSHWIVWARYQKATTTSDLYCAGPLLACTGRDAAKDICTVGAALQGRRPAAILHGHRFRSRHRSSPGRTTPI